MEDTQLLLIAVEIFLGLESEYPPDIDLVRNSYHQQQIIIYVSIETSIDCKYFGFICLLFDLNQLLDNWKVVPVTK